ncbi:hypothetical protein D3C80_1631880 [compost metagenome]
MLYLNGIDTNTRYQYITISRLQICSRVTDGTAYFIAMHHYGFETISAAQHLSRRRNLALHDRFTDLGRAHIRFMDQVLCDLNDLYRARQHFF